MSVARDDGRVIGVAAHSFYRMALAGGQRLGDLLGACDDGSGCAGTRCLRRSRAQARGGGKGSRRSSRARIRIRSDRTALPRAARVDADRQAAYLGAAAAAPEPAARPRRADPTVRVRRRRRFAGGRTTSCATPSTSNWRYLDSPRDYVAYRARGGYAVLGHKRHRGHHDRARRGPRRAARPLLRACVAGVRARNARRSSALPGRGRTRRLRSRCGFVPTPLYAELHGQGARRASSTPIRAPGASRSATRTSSDAAPVFLDAERRP